MADAAETPIAGKMRGTILSWERSLSRLKLAKFFPVNSGRRLGVINFALLMRS